MTIDKAGLFAQGLPFDGPVDVAYFEHIPNADVARAALEFLNDQSNEIELLQRHVQEDVTRMWKAAFRGCLSFGVPIPDELKGYARRLGVIVP